MNDKVILTKQGYADLEKKIETYIEKATIDFYICKQNPSQSIYC